MSNTNMTYVCILLSRDRLGYFDILCARQPIIRIISDGRVGYTEIMYNNSGRLIGWLGGWPGGWVTGC